jgi:hypothetical protein
MPRRPPISTETSQAYATSAEFCRVFTEDMDSMHLLSFLLTGDLTEAEECFVSGLEDCAKESYVFRDWARSWARRTIVQNAIRMLTPRKNHSAVADVPRDPVSCSFGRTPDADYAIGSILRLEDRTAQESAVGAGETRPPAEKAGLGCSGFRPVKWRAQDGSIDIEPS